MASESTSIPPTTPTPASTTTVVSPTSSQRRIIDAVIAERARQDQIHGPVPLTREHTGHPSLKDAADQAKDEVAQQVRQTGDATWDSILWEEFMEALAEGEWSACRTELVQVAAVCFSWIEDGDKKDAAKQERAKLREGLRVESVINPPPSPDQGADRAS